MRMLAFLLLTFAASGQPPQRPPAGPLRAGVWRGRPIRYTVVDGHAAVGDILIARLNADGSLPQSSGTATKAWPGGVIPYVLDPTLTNRDRLLASMRAWQDAGVQFVERTNQKDYIRIASPAYGCNSYVGMQGGEQTVNFADGCIDGAVTHELGHAIGLFHEHTRRDRDQWVEIHRENIVVTCPFESDFALSADSQDLFAYDFGSIMHYDGWNNTRNGLPSIVSIPPYIPIGEAAIKNTGPSQTDIESVRKLYGKAPRGTTIDTLPVGQPIVVDGVSYTAPRTFQWADGSSHTIGAPPSVQTDADTRHTFARWSDNGAPQHTITASASMPVYSASFIRHYRIQTKDPQYGSIKLSPPSPGGFYPQTSYVTATLVPEAGYLLQMWDGIDTFPMSMANQAHPFGYVNPHIFNVETPKTISAYMTSTRVYPVILNTDPPNLDIRVDGAWSYSPGLLLPGTHHLEAQEIITQCGPCEAGNARLVFQGWDGVPGKNPAIDIASPSPGSPVVTYTAKYKRQYKLSITVNGSGKVDVSPPSPDGFYDEDVVVRATPQPSAGSRFFDWFGLPGNLDALYQSDAPTYNKCGNPLLYRMNIPFFAYPQMTPARPSGTKPVITVAGVVNAASGAGNGVSPGEIMTFYGQKLGPNALVPADVTTSGYFDNCLARTIVTFDGVAAPVVYSLAGQVSVIVPYGVVSKSSTQVVLEYADNRSDTLTLPVLAAKPGFFTADSSGKGAGAFLDLNYRLITSQNPVARDSYAQLYATGAGQTNPAGTDGALALDYQNLPKPVLPVKVFIGGVEAEVAYAGAGPDLVAGVLQINVRIPDSAPTGDAVPIVVQVGSARSPDGVTIAVK